MPSPSTLWTLRAQQLLPVVLSLPALVYMRDQWGSVCRVRGASMEPYLRDGDVVWVRKADAGTLWKAIRESVFGSGNNNNNNDVEQQERQRVVRYEVLQGINGHVGLLYAKPLAVTAGDMVVYQNPTQLDREFLVKRCIGVGGQWIRQELPVDPYQHLYDGKGNPAQYQYRLQALPPFTIYVEGSNAEKSVDDSRTHGPISKNLVVGIAEYCIWPPTRWQRLQRTPQTVQGDPEETPRAVWY